MDFSGHRLQLRIRGQRFEAAVDVLTSTCTAFRVYFTQAALAPSDAALPALELYLPGELPTTMYPVTLDVAKKLFLVDVAKASGAGGCSSSNGGLDPEFVGVVLVYLRNFAKKQQQARLSARWDEMPYDQQRSFATVVTAFGVEPLLPAHGTPTAMPGGPAAVTVSDAAMLHGGRSLVDVANEYAAGKQQLQGAEDGHGGAPLAAGQPHPSEHDDDLVMPAAGCFKCGVSGHDAAVCPHP